MSQVITEQPLCELPVNYVLSEDEKTRLSRLFLELDCSPYTDYDGFMRALGDLISSDEIPPQFASFCEEVKGTDRAEEPFALIKNCPIDEDVPVFDFAEPVESKRALKKTFVAEAFLGTFALLVDTPPIGYINVNDGDVFQDIYPKESMKDSQSQKALGGIYFHKDLANHFVRPDYVNMLSMRSDPRNQAYTCFVRNREALDRLPDDVRETLRREEFHTPFDDLTVSSSNVDVGEAPNHPVLSDELDLRFFENRTVGVTDEAKEAVRILKETLHELKARVLMVPAT